MKKIKELVLGTRKDGLDTKDRKVRAQVLQRGNYRCYLCQREYTRNKSLAKRKPKQYFSDLQIDHIVPFSVIGRAGNNLSNYLPTCSRCNQLKSDKTLREAMRLIKEDIKERGY